MKCWQKLSIFKKNNVSKFEVSKRGNINTKFSPKLFFLIENPPERIRKNTLKVTFWHILTNCQYGNTGCRVFKRGVQNYKDFCIRINIPKDFFLILRIGVMGRCQKLGIILVIY